MSLGHYNRNFGFLDLNDLGFYDNFNYTSTSDWLTVDNTNRLLGTLYLTQDVAKASVSIGDNIAASTRYASTILGDNITTTGSFEYNNVVIGANQATGASNNTIVGTSNIMVDTFAQNNLIVGYSNTSNSHNNVIVIGDSATTTADDQCILATNLFEHLRSDSTGFSVNTGIKTPTYLQMDKTTTPTGHSSSQGRLYYDSTSTEGCGLHYVINNIIDIDYDVGGNVRVVGATTGDSIARWSATIGSDTLLEDGLATLDATGNITAGNITAGFGQSSFAGVGGFKFTHTTAPNLELYNALDTYPLMSMISTNHDNSALLFDAYYNVGYKSGYAGANFMIQKYANKLNFAYEFGVTAGTAVTWQNAMQITQSGQINFHDSQTSFAGGGLYKFTGPASSTNGPHLEVYLDSDIYPTNQLGTFTHDNTYLAFDAYYNGGWKSSDAGSNYNIYKSTDKFKIQYDSGVAQGSVITWNDGIVLDTTGLTTFAAAGIAFTNTATTADQLSYYKYTTHATTITNVGGSFTDTASRNIKCVRNGQNVTLTLTVGSTYFIDGTQSVGNASYYATVTAIPAEFRPTVNHYGVIVGRNTGTTQAVVYYLTSTGIIYFYSDPSFSVWGTGNNSVRNFNISYIV